MSSTRTQTSKVARTESAMGQSINDDSSDYSDQWKPALLDRTQPQPLYEQIIDALRDLIDTTPLLPNEKIPSERELSERFAVNRLTVRKAIDELVQEGVLFRQHGKGTFVSPPKLTQPLLVVRSFTEAMLQEGRLPGTYVHSVERRNGGAHVCRQLNIPLGTTIIELVRVRTVDSLPIALITSYIPNALVGTLDLEEFESVSLYALLQDRCGLSLVRSYVTLEPTVASHQESALLEIEPSQPLLLLRGLVYNEQESIVEYSKALYRGDKVRFAVHSQQESR